MKTELINKTFMAIFSVCMLGYALCVVFFFAAFLCVLYDPVLMELARDAITGRGLFSAITIITFIIGLFLNVRILYLSRKLVMQYEYYGELVAEMAAKLTVISRLLYIRFYLGVVEFAITFIPKTSKSFEADDNDGWFDNIFDGLLTQFSLETRGVTAIVLALLCQLLANYAKERLAMKKDLEFTV